MVWEMLVRKQASLATSLKNTVFLWNFVFEERGHHHRHHHNTTHRLTSLAKQKHNCKDVEYLNTLPGGLKMTGHPPAAAQLYTLLFIEFLNSFRARGLDATIFQLMTNECAAPGLSAMAPSHTAQSS